MRPPLFQIEGEEELPRPSLNHRKEAAAGSQGSGVDRTLYYAGRDLAGVALKFGCDGANRGEAQESPASEVSLATRACIADRL